MPKLFDKSDPVPHMSVFLLLRLVGLHFEGSAGKSFPQQRCRWSGDAEAMQDVEMPKALKLLVDLDCSERLVTLVVSCFIHNFLRLLELQTVWLIPHDLSSHKTLIDANNFPARHSQ